MVSTKNKLIKSIKIDYLFYGCYIILNFLLTPLILKYAGRENFGYWSSLNAMIAYFGLADFGFGVYLIKKIQEYSDISNRNKVYNTAFFCSFLLTFSLGVIVFIGVNTYKTFFPVSEDFLMIQNSFFIIMFFLIIIFPCSLFTNLLYAEHKVKQIVIITGIGNLLSLLATFIFIYLDFGFSGFIYGFILGQLFPVVVSYFYIKIKLNTYSLSIGNFSKKMLIDMKNFNVWFILAKMAKLMRDNTDSILILFMLSPIEVSVYALTYKLPLLIIALSFRVVSQVTPTIADKIAKNNLTALKKYFLFITKLSLIVPIGIAGGIFLINEYFISIWVGKENYAGDLFTFFICLILIKDIFVNNVGIIMFLSKYIKQQTLALFIEAVCNIILTVVLIPRFGITGALLATLLSGFFTTLIYVPKLICNYLSIDFGEYFKNIIIVLLKQAPVIFTSFLIFYLLNYSNYFNNNVMLCIAGLSMYGCVFLLTNLLWGNHKELLSIYHEK